MKSQIGKIVLLLWTVALAAGNASAYSMASRWNEVLLEAIRHDQARPTVHARNLFHISAAMYDSWAAYDTKASTYFLNQVHRGFYIPFDGVELPASEKDILKARETALSYAAYRLITHRFKNSPGFEEIEKLANALMRSFKYDIAFRSKDYKSDNPAALGNYIAAKIIEFGLQDGSNETRDYGNRYYEPLNPSLSPERPGSGGLLDAGRWQPLRFETIQFVGQSGISSDIKIPEFVGPEWGLVVPFSLSEDDLKIYERDGNEYWVYHDPGAPWYIDASGVDQNYQWSFGLTAQWSSHLDATDGVIWDISPASIGNIPFDQLPKNPSEYRDFYKLEEGGDSGEGYLINPKTNEPYEPQYVPRGDYTRVLAEFWADGPSSETPPGHWFTILNTVNGDRALVRKYRGQGEVVDPLEWDVKSYFVLGGAMHDAAVTVWGIKGYYDYIRPISAIRKMAEMGQCSDPDLPNYNPSGLALNPGFVELITSGDPLSGQSGGQIGKIKIKAWQQDYNAAITGEPLSQGVSWIYGENWSPYQRPSFVTPPFAGYVSGHSTFSRAAARVLSLFTGDDYFPGGLGEFEMKKDEFLEFDTGPSVDLKLQWAKYTDASDQCSLSRIWGGIHPPVDDIPGRLIGEEIGREAFAFAEKYFLGEVEKAENPNLSTRYRMGPNPLKQGESFTLFTDKFDEFKKHFQVYDQTGTLIHSEAFYYVSEIDFNTYQLNPGMYFITISSRKYTEMHRLLVYK